MTKVILDPRKVSEAEPIIREARASMMLSANAVPRAITVVARMPELVNELQIEYAGQELLKEELLDGGVNPRVMLAIGLVTDKIVRLKFDPPANFRDLESVSMRLKARAGNLTPAKRLSFLMIATVLSMLPRSAAV